MGLFGQSFEKKVDEALAKVRGMGFGVEKLAAKVDGKVVTLTGEVESVEMKSQVMNAFNALVESENTLNQIRVRKAPAAVAVGVAVPAAEPSERWHEVVRGDTLSALAKTYYGKAGAYMKIFEANRDVLDSPDLIKVGQRLKIPD